jgi:hypothetical protein
MKNGNGKNGLDDVRELLRTVALQVTVHEREIREIRKLQAETMRLQIETRKDLKIISRDVQSLAKSVKSHDRIIKKKLLL